MIAVRAARRDFFKQLQAQNGRQDERKEQHICVGYRDISDSEFWVRGHMPGMPLMPGVIMCEAAAQLASYYSQRYDLLGAEMVGFGGIAFAAFSNFIRSLWKF